MSDIEKLVYPTEIDATGWAKGIQEGLKVFDDFDARIKSKLDNMKIPAPQVGAPSAPGEGSGAGGADLAATVLPLAGKIQSSLASALAPLNGFAARFGAQFDQVGATIIAISKRIDGHLRFPTFQKGIEAARGVISKNFDAMSDKAKQYARVADAALGGVQIASKVKQFVGSLGGLNAKLGDFGKIKAPNLNFDNSTRSVLSLTNVTNNATRAFKGLGVQIGLALGLFGLAFKAVGFLKEGISSASNLNETISKTDAILGDSSAGVKKFADDMASRFGLVKGEVLDVASGIGGLGKGLGGLSGAGLEKFTTDFTKLAADLSSFSNISLQDAGKALQIGLSGEQSDTLKRLGVVVTENTIKNYAYANGIAKVGSELTEQQKIMARAGVIQRALADASGDLEKTAGGTANQWRKLTGTIANLGTSVGTALLPVLTKVVSTLAEFGEWATKAFAGHQGEIEAFFAPVSTGIDFVVAGFHNWQSVVEVARLTIIQALANVGEYFDTIGPNIITVATYVANNWKELLADAFNATLAGLKNLWTNWQALGTAIGEWFADPTRGFNFKWTPLLDGFKATAEKFPELLKPVLTDMTKEIADASKPIFDEVEKKAADAKARADALANAGKKAAPGGPDEVAKKAKEGPQFAGALERGSAESRTTILNAIGSGNGKGDQAVAKNTAEANNLLRSLNSGVRAKKAPPIFTII